MGSVIGVITYGDHHRMVIVVSIHECYLCIILRMVIVVSITVISIYPYYSIMCMILARLPIVGVS